MLHENTFFSLFFGVKGNGKIKLAIAIAIRYYGDMGRRFNSRPSQTIVTLLLKCVPKNNVLYC